ncbi:MAG: DNA topoisomerase VI subunit B [Planctomycetes bacterium]|nr:DNA topoisomerase VI subunit B [Planctomycetota bacterium]
MVKGQGSLFGPDAEEESEGVSKKRRSKKANDGSETAKPSRGSGGSRKTAEAMAKSQREISVSEFFTKNRHLLGFDNPRKALLTAVKEAVDNSLDACEEAGILPDLLVEIRQLQGYDDRYTVIVQDNGPGIVKAQVPNIFGKLLYGSKFHRLKQSRGQQGIGISAAGMYGQLTTGNPVRITSRTGKRAKAHYFEVRLNTSKNKPEFTDEERESDFDHGTRVEIDMQAEYRRGMRSVDEYLKQTAVSNPHVRLTWNDPNGNTIVYERGTDELPQETKEIKPHPHGIELGLLIKMLSDSNERTLHAFLQTEFSRVSAKVSHDICDIAKLSTRAHPKRIARAEADRLHAALGKVKIMAPPTNCIAPIGEAVLLAGLQKEIKADFYTASTRPPAVYRGNPFIIEAALAYGREGDTMEVTDEGKILTRKKAASHETELLGNADEAIRLVRFANRVPLQHQQSACAITKGVISVAWKNYMLSQPKGALPIGPMVLIVHIASVWVPFTSESKEAIASYPEILKELKLAVQECGRKLATHIRKGKRIATEYMKRDYIATYLPHIGLGLQEILGISDEVRDNDVAILTDVLERTRKV